MSDSRTEVVLAYHERTKHRPGSYARSLGYMDWETQPDPFRRYEDCELLLLDEAPLTNEPVYDQVFQCGIIRARPLDRASVSQLFYDSLALSAWKELGHARWSLRVNPSSGALYPTEGYLLAGPIPGLADSSALYHYSPFHHGLELRKRLALDLPADSFLVGLTEIHWRESWKYGERAFRYCNLDAGHAIAAIAVAASALGWNVRLLEGWTDREMADLLGVAEQQGVEAEHPDCLMLIHTAGRADTLDTGLPARMAGAPLHGTPNRLSSAHHPWPTIDEVAVASARMESPAESYLEPRVEQPSETLPRSPRELPARQVIRQRRSAVAMDGQTGIDRDTFCDMLTRLLPRPGSVPFGTLPWKPAIHLVLFVHRVKGLDGGLYALVREPGALEDLRAAMRSDFAWSRPDGCPGELPLYLLARGDRRNEARAISCVQDIASDGAFAVAMLAEFEPRLREHGAWFYRRLYWESDRPTIAARTHLARPTRPGGKPPTR